jgi:hypothetical protein
MVNGESREGYDAKKRVEEKMRYGLTLHVLVIARLGRSHAIQNSFLRCFKTSCALAYSVCEAAAMFIRGCFVAGLDAGDLCCHVSTETSNRGSRQTDSAFWKANSN